MSEIIYIDESIVKIAKEDDTIFHIPLSAINYADPQIGDRVKVYQDGEEYIVSRVATAEKPLPENYVEMDKHIFVWVFTFLLGCFGIDRFIRGQIGLGVCKLLLGWATIGIWPLVDWIIAVMKAYGTSYGKDQNIVFDEQGKYTK